MNKVFNKSISVYYWWIIFIFFGILSLTSQSTFAAPQDNKNNKVITFGMQPLWLPSASIISVMKRDLILENRLKTLGIKLNFIPLNNGVEINKALLEGRVQIGVGGDMPTILACVGQPIKVMSLIDVSFTSVVSKEHFTARELKGKRIAYTPGTNAHFGLLKLIKAANIDLADVDLVAMGIVDMPEALSQGKVDAFSAWELTPSIAMAQFPNMRRISRSSTTGYLYMSTEFVENNPKVAQEILAAQSRAMLWLDNKTENINKAVNWTKEYGGSFSDLIVGLPDSVVRSLLTAELLPFVGSPYVPDEYFEEGGKISDAVSFLQSINRIPSDVEWSKVERCFNTSYMSEVLLNPFKFQLNEFDIKENQGNDNIDVKGKN